MDECIDTLSEAKIFSALDCNSGYWPIPIDENDREETAFVSHHGFFRFARIPFGLTNSPGMFQRAVDIVLSSVRWKFAILYLNDVTVFSKTRDAPLTHLKAVLTLLKDAELTLKLRKCLFLQGLVKYLRQIVSPSCLHVAPKTCNAVHEMQPPTNVTQLCSFLVL